MSINSYIYHHHRAIIIIIIITIITNAFHIAIGPIHYFNALILIT